MWLFILYAYRAVIGIYAIAIVAGPAPGTSASTVLIGLNAISLLAASIIYNTKHTVTGLIRVAASCIAIIVLAVAANNILFALLIQVAGIFHDIETAIGCLLLLQGSLSSVRKTVKTASVMP